MNLSIPSDPAELLRIVNEALAQHLPGAQAWLPTAGFVGIGLLGLIFMTFGARLAAVTTAIVAAGATGSAGGALALQFGLPVWPTVATCGLGGAVFAFLTFRFLLASTTAVAVALAGIGAYGLTTLLPHLNTYTSSGLNDGLVSLPEAAGAPVSLGPLAEVGAIWAHLSANVPAFQTSFFAITVVGAVVGLLVGFLLPWAARSLWGATIGTVCFAVALVALLEQFFPAANVWLKGLGPWGWSLVASCWLTSLLYNMFSAKQRKPAASCEADPQPAIA